MHTKLHPALASRPSTARAEAIIRKCVHCGFCNAVCPTYQLRGDELDGPRGRIYLIRQLLETDRIGERAREHLDRCLTCRSCETVCPSGVEYGALIDIGRELAHSKTEPGPGQRVMRFLLRAIVPYPRRFGALLRLGQAVRRLLPGAWRRLVPLPATAGTEAGGQDATPERHVIILTGCVQSRATPAVAVALERLLAKVGVAATRVEEGCCGALDYHLSQPAKAETHARHVIDACWPNVEAGAEAIVSSASGCGVHIKDYGALLAHDPAYHDRAMRVAGLCRDASEVLVAEMARLPAAAPPASLKVACHLPCSLQHGQRLTGKVEALLARAGVELTPVPESHLCCGSAGSYWLLQRELAQALLDRKVENLMVGAPDLIVTANVGCQHFLASQAPVPVRHWLELLDDIYSA